MKAVYIEQYGGPENLVYGEIDRPVPGKHGLLIKMKAVSVNPVDWKVRNGRLKFITGKKFPFVVGSELSGVIEQTGEGVLKFKKGDRVYALLGYRGGACAEYVAVKEKQAIGIPDEMSFEDASTIAIAGLAAYQAFTIHYQVKPGDEVLVNGGSGGVGSYAVQIAKILGARVTAVCSERNREYVTELGADEVINYREEDFRERISAYDVILDAASNASFREVRNSLTKGGMLIKLNLSSRSLVTQVMTKLFSSRKLKLILVKNRKQDLQWIIDQIVEGKIRVFIEKVYPLEKTREAQEQSQTGRVRGKLVIKSS
ncbi:MAG: NAD(P)-dependent alcohol dehydrogenase [Bacteroidales bacterium]|nr:NAD(P)-dependent alcohol dehydrogenase [Bacteroidales bacterium]